MTRRPYYVIMDASHRVLNMVVEFDGKKRLIPAVLVREEDALSIAAEAEIISHRLHAVVPISTEFNPWHAPQSTEAA